MDRTSPAHGTPSALGRQQATEIAQARTDRNILWLGEPACHDPFVVGGKAASLSRLAADHPVPPGFALTTTLFDPTSESGGTTGLPASARDEVIAAYRLLAEHCGVIDPAVAVRSSAVDEDGSDASFAGQHETFLNITGAEAVLDAVERCWGSFTAPHAIEYRRKQGLPIEGVRVAVLIQQLVVADAAAVVFTADPIAGDRSAVVINASWGLGESIVGGTVTPDIYVVGKDDLAIRRRDIADKRRMTVAVPTGTAEVDVPGFLRERPALHDGQIAEMARLALALERTAGRPVDLECAYRGGRLYLLQCRPITTLGHQTPDRVARESSSAAASVDPLPTPGPSRAPASVPGVPIAPPPGFPVTWQRPDDARLLWTLDRVHWPHPIPPLVFAIVGDALAHGLSAAAAHYELPLAKVRVQRINGYRYQANVPLDCPPDEAQARRERSQEKLHTAMAGLRASWTEAWLPEVKQHLAFWESFDLAGASLPALLAHLDETLRRAERLWQIHFLLASPMHGAISQFGKLYRELTGRSTLDAYRLLRGLDNKILLAGKALWYLSRLALALPEVRAVLEGESGDVLAALDRTEQGRGFLEELRSYLEDFGQRGESLYLERPSWIEDPLPVVEHLRGLMGQTDRDVAGEMVATWEESERLVADVRRMLAGYSAPVRDEFEFLFAAAQEAVVLTEDHNYWIDARGMYCVRQVLLEVGRRFAAEGALAAPEDVFHLTVPELRKTAHTHPPIPRQALVARRRAELERFRFIAPPAELGSRPAESTARGDGPGRESSAAPGSEAAGPPRMLRGHAGSPGRVRGTVRVLRSLADAGKLRRGDILVAETLSSSWTPLFATAAGLVTDTGGILSHSAVVAREYGIPAVLAAAEATSLLRDGQRVEVDGDRGTVLVLDRLQQPGADG